MIKQPRSMLEDLSAATSQTDKALPNLTTPPHPERHTVSLPRSIWRTSVQSVLGSSNFTLPQQTLHHLNWKLESAHPTLTNKTVPSTSRLILRPTTETRRTLRFTENCLPPYQETIDHTLDASLLKDLPFQNHSSFL